MRRCVLVLSLLAASCSFKPDGEGTSPDAPVDAMEIDACVPTTETCEGTDQDCDGMIDEGFTTGAACDGPDADNCLDDVTICNAAGNEVCGDTSGDDDAELCNGADDDCDGTMDEGFAVGAPCDGADGDQCNEGTLACSGDGTGTTCSDTTDTIAELCNGADDDCDLLIDDGFDLTSDEANCGQCGNTCTNAHGTTTCTLSVCVPSCTSGAAQCDGDPDNGCELQDTNPACVAGAATAITLDGDVADTDTLTGTTEQFIKVRLRESLTASGVDITAQLALLSGVGARYHLHVYCPTCGSTPISDVDDVVEVGRADGSGDRSFDVFVEIRYDGTVPSTTCAPWTLNLTGNVATANRCGGN